MNTRPDQSQIKQKQLQDQLARRSKLVRQILITNNSFVNYQLVIPSFNLNKMLLSGQTYSLPLPYTYQANTPCQLRAQIVNRILNFSLNPNGDLILPDEGLEIRSITNEVEGEFFYSDQPQNNLLLIKI
jgi:hypothetical protein